MTTHPFDATMLTRDESDAIAAVLPLLDGLDDAVDSRVLLGAIPMLDEDGTEIVGYLRQGDDWQWRFMSAQSFDPADTLLLPVRRHLPEYDHPYDGDDNAA